MEVGLVFSPLIYLMMIHSKIMENRLWELELRSSIDQALQFRHISYLQTMYPSQVPVTQMQLSGQIMRSPLETSTCMYPPTHLPGNGLQLPITAATGCE